MGNRKANICCSIVIVIFFSCVLLFLAGYGKAGRVTGVPVSLDDRRIAKELVNRPEEAYGIWEKSGHKGRMVVSLSRRLNFIETHEETFIPHSPFPVKVFNLATSVEATLDDKNFLFVSLLKGIAREIIHIVPEQAFQEKLRFAEKNGIAATNGKINVPFRGSPRWIAPLSELKPIREPVLLYVNASFFEEVEPAALFNHLRDIGLKTDLVVLCRSFDDDEVTPLEREKLDAFARMIGEAGGKR